MLLEIFLTTVANIAITTVVSYIFVQFIPKQRPFNLPAWKKASIILISGITTFVLMSFSVDLPQEVKIDLRFNVLILLFYYFGPEISIPTIFLTAVLRLSWGISDAAIYTFLLYIVLGAIMPFVTKWLSRRFTNYATVLLLNVMYIIGHTSSLFFIYHDLKRILFISSLNLLISSVCLVLVVAFIEDMIANVQRYIEEVNRAKVDYLTGLYNKREFSSQWKEIEKNQNILQTAFLILDIDHFKCVNDQYGHMNGDLVLQQVANLLHVQGVEDKNIYRVGGEEFCIVLNNISCTKQKRLAEEIRLTVEKHPFALENHRTIYLTISIGIASLSKEKDMKNLYRLADQALYKAKENGRNQVVALELDE